MWVWYPYFETNHYFWLYTLAKISQQIYNILHNLKHKSGMVPKYQWKLIVKVQYIKYKMCEREVHGTFQARKHCKTVCENCIVCYMNSKHVVVVVCGYCIHWSDGETIEFMKVCRGGEGIWLFDYEDYHIGHTLGGCGLFLAKIVWHQQLVVYRHIYSFLFVVIMRMFPSLLLFVSYAS